MFGRRKTPPPAPPGTAYPDQPPGHAHVLALLDREEHEKPLQRAQLTGRVIFDWVCEAFKDERGIRMESLLATLASVGGQQCIEPLLESLKAGGRTAQDAGIMEVKTTDGSVYFFGDAPNELLVESPMSLISLAFGAAKDCGAAVTMDMIHDEMRTVASSLGSGEAFFEFPLPEHIQIGNPMDWAALVTPKIVDLCNLYRVPPLQRATAIGFAIARAIVAGKQAIDPLIAARIVLGCATRCAKVDPAAMEKWRQWRSST